MKYLMPLKMIARTIIAMLCLLATIKSWEVHKRSLKSFTPIAFQQICKFGDGVDPLDEGVA
jgi:hypothetical protein